MKRILFLIIAFLISVNVFSQSFEGISGLKYLSSDTIDNGHTFIWRGDTIYFNNLWNKSQITVQDTARWGSSVSDGRVAFYGNHSLLGYLDDAYYDIVGGKITPKSATGTNNGALSSTDWTTFNNKLGSFTESDPLVSSWAKAESKPSYAYSEITSKPTLFSGSYTDLTNKPYIPTMQNDSVQALSGTTVTWDMTRGKRARITLTGNTTITLTNVAVGEGKLFVTNATPAYTLTFAGYSFIISQNVWALTGDRAATSGGGKSDSFSWSYDGYNVEINGTLDMK